MFRSLAWPQGGRRVGDRWVMGAVEHVEFPRRRLGIQEPSSDGFHLGRPFSVLLHCHVCRKRERCVSKFAWRASPHKPSQPRPWQRREPIQAVGRAAIGPTTAGAP